MQAFHNMIATEEPLKNVDCVSLVDITINQNSPDVPVSTINRAG